ncbi:MAG: helix-turn-helix domain-containing protein [Staphylococcus rostri]|uniref:helix-turn-helix domain-containing protein n=1 Tax=Staphylococcus rostri TaxID=522262 RepID=UPI0026E0CD97|nr:helix-turn-helix domain-containing protein [Staphylococcus rostri]MDO5375725.1 helix-turn-helix domain-containing protein [Staphylococcus rostri]
MPKIIEIPNESNVLLDEKVYVKKLYAKATRIHELFSVSRSTIYKWLKAYEEDNLGVENLYIDLSANMTLVNIEKLEEYLRKRHKKWMKGGD